MLALIFEMLWLWQAGLFCSLARPPVIEFFQNERVSEAKAVTPL